MNFKEALLALIEKTPDVPVGYISTTNIFRDEVRSVAEEIGGVYKEIVPSEYRANLHNRSVEYVVVEDIGSIENGLQLAYNILESVGLVIMVERKGLDIWSISEKCQENFLSEAIEIELGGDYSLVTTKKLLRS